MITECDRDQPTLKLTNRGTVTDTKRLVDAVSAVGDRVMKATIRRIIQSHGFDVGILVGLRLEGETAPCFIPRSADVHLLGNNHDAVIRYRVTSPFIVLPVIAD